MMVFQKQEGRKHFLLRVSNRTASAKSYDRHRDKAIAGAL